MYQNPVLFPPITNRESFQRIIELADDDTGELIDLTDCDIVLEVRRADPRSNMAYGPWYDAEEALSSPVLSASVGSGITIKATGTFEVVFTRTQMRALNAGTYDVGCTITSADDDEDVRELFLGRLPVLRGNVS